MLVFGSVKLSPYPRKQIHGPPSKFRGLGGSIVTGVLNAVETPLSNSQKSPHPEFSIEDLTICLGGSPCLMPVTIRIMTWLVGGSFKPSFAIVTGGHTQSVCFFVNTLGEYTFFSGEVRI